MSVKINDGLTADQRWYRRNRKAKIAKNRRWRKAHPKQANETARRYQARWRKANPELDKQKRAKERASAKAQGKNYYQSDAGRDRHLRLSFGITLADYNRMLAEQGGRCFVCTKLPSGKSKGSGRIKNLVVDHDHKTGRIRHLLCRSCNLMVGNAHDNPLLLEKAAAMLREAQVPGALRTAYLGATNAR